MESERLYESLLPHVRGLPSERAWLREILQSISPGSLDRAAYQLLNLEMIKEKHPAVYATVKEVLVDTLKANVFSQVRLRTTMACLAVMGSQWAPEKGLKGSIHQLVEDAVKANAESPIYQVFFRAVDYSWTEMVKVGARLGNFGSSVAMELKVGEVTATRAKLWVSGTDARAFGGLVLPGFLRGVMAVLRVVGTVEISDEDSRWIELSFQWV